MFMNCAEYFCTNLDFLLYLKMLSNLVTLCCRCILTRMLRVIYKSPPPRVLCLVCSSWADELIKFDETLKHMLGLLSEFASAHP